jgi:hypothetical protein
LTEIAKWCWASSVTAGGTLLLDFHRPSLQRAPVHPGGGAGARGSLPRLLNLHPRQP